MPPSSSEAPVPDCAPPKEIARQPSYAMPEGAWDVHFHVLGPWRKFPYARDRAFTPHDVPKEKILAVHRQLGIGRGVAVQPSLYGTDHGTLLDLLAAGAGRYRGVIGIEWGIDEKLVEALHAKGIRGVRLSLSHGRSMPPLDPIRRTADLIGPRGWHLDFHGDSVGEGRLKALLSLGLPIVIDHMSRYSWRVDHPRGVDQAPFRELLDARRNERFWIKLSCADRISKVGAPFDDVVPYARALVDSAPDRVVWGTDYPNTNHPNVPDCADLVDAIPLFAPDPAVRQGILVDNPARLYG